MRLGELTYLADQIVTFCFSSLELRNKASEYSKHHETLNIFYRCSKYYSLFLHYVLKGT